MKCFVALLALVAVSHGYSLGYERNMMLPSGYNIIQRDFMGMDMDMDRDMYVNQELFTQESWPRQCEKVFRQLQVAGIIYGEQNIDKMVQEVKMVQNTILSVDQKIASIFTVLKHHGVVFTRETVPVIARVMLTVFRGQEFYPIHQLEQFFQICEQYGMKWDVEYATYFVRYMVIKSNNLPVQYFQQLLAMLQTRFGQLSDEVIMCALRYVCRIQKDAVYPIENLARLFQRIEKVQHHMIYDQQTLIAFFDQLYMVQKSVSPIYKKVEKLVNFFQAYGVEQQEIVIPCVKLVLDMSHEQHMVLHKHICQLLELLHAHGMPMKLYYVQQILEYYLQKRNSFALPLTREGLNGLLMAPETPFEIKTILKEIEMHQFQYPTGFSFHGMPRDYFYNQEFNAYQQYPTIYGQQGYSMGPYQYQQYQPRQMWNQQYQYQTPFYQQGFWERMMQHYPAMHQYRY